ncbi:MAG: hypothetical protein M3169_08255 [Candidatus Eremiobacteraeota bacterium]|nr:hypothetical protein [Candidatus Eremiobacteraeota bacterium]
MDPLDGLFAALLGVGSLGFFSMLFVAPPYYASFPRGVTLAIRTLYCIAGTGLLFTADLIVRDPHRYRTISTVLFCTTVVNLIAILLERVWLSRQKHRMNERE